MALCETSRQVYSIILCHTWFKGAIYSLIVSYSLLCITCVHNYAGAVIEGPSNVTYLPGLTTLPIELTCDVTGVAAWRINGTAYTLTDLTNGALPGHSRTGTNILVNSPVNNTEYICVSTTNDGETTSDAAYIVIAGESHEYQIFI